MTVQELQTRADELRGELSVAQNAAFEVNARTAKWWNDAIKLAYKVGRADEAVDQAKRKTEETERQA